MDFTKTLAKLVQEIEENGYETTFDQSTELIDVTPLPLPMIRPGENDDGI
jgi:hypothetical protein